MNSKNNEILFLLGRSASGKTTTLNELVKRGEYKNLVSYTTRAIRDNEIEGIDYHFVDIDTFNSLGLKVTFEVNESWKYGLSFNELKGRYVFQAISQDYIYSAMQEAQKNGFNVKLIVFSLSRVERLRRLLSRGETEESIQKRFEIESNEGDYNLDLFDNFNCRVINTDNLTVNDMVNEVLKE